MQPIPRNIKTTKKSNKAPKIKGPTVDPRPGNRAPKVKPVVDPRPGKGKAAMKPLPIDDRIYRTMPITEKQLGTIKKMYGI